MKSDAVRRLRRFCPHGRQSVTDSKQGTIVPAVPVDDFLSQFADMLIAHRVLLLGNNLYLGTHECF